MSDPVTFYEVRLGGEAGLFVTSLAEDREDAKRVYEEQLADLKPGFRLELVKVTESVEVFAGTGDRIDPWNTIKIIYRSTRGGVCR